MKNNHFHNHDGVYELSPITNRLLLVKPLTEHSLHVCHGRLALFNLFSALPSTAFAKFGHKLFSKIILGVFMVWKKRGFREKKSCGSKCLFVDHRASRTSQTHDSSERHQQFISVPFTIQTSFFFDERKHYAIQSPFWITMAFYSNRKSRKF